MNNDEVKGLREILRKIAELATSTTNSVEISSGITQKITCTPKSLPKHLVVPAAKKAVEINPSNHPPVKALRALVPNFEFTKERIGILTSKKWDAKGVYLSVGFLDDPPPELSERILKHMNAWSKTANVGFVEFVETAILTQPQVRIARKQGDGHWSYLGTDILSIPSNEPTMNLDSFTMDTDESEFFRVVRHETGHTLGFPHEHMRRDLVNLIDEAKAIAYFLKTQGWTPEEVRTQVLTPIEESTLSGTPFANPNSIMCYQIPGTITIDGKPILGGVVIDDSDYQYAAQFYPKDS